MPVDAPPELACKTTTLLDHAKITKSYGCYMQDTESKSCHIELQSFTGIDSTAHAVFQIRRKTTSGVSGPMADRSGSA